MSTLSYLSEDFKNIALSDLQVSITITHYSGQVLNTSTGEYSDVTSIESGEGIIDSIKKKDIELFPDRLSIKDKKLYLDSGDFSFTIKKGDKIQVGTNGFTVLELTDLDDVLLLYIRKVN